MRLLLVIVIAALGVQAQELPTSGCVCVKYYQCSSNGTIIDDGSSVLGERFVTGEFEVCRCPTPSNPFGQRCRDPLNVCCHVPEQTQTTVVQETTTEEPEEAESWDSCGEKGFNPSDTAVRVITGTGQGVTYPSEFPWMAMLLNKQDNTMLCGASVLHHHVVMTAAHCVHSFQAPQLLVRAGVWQRTTTAETQTSEVDRIIKHEQFGPSNYRNDIALLMLKQELRLSPTVKPICLPEPGTRYDNMLCIATGWGSSQYRVRELSDTLKKVELSTVPHGQCQNQLRNTSLSPWFKLHESFVCAKGENGLDTCTGDGGGPLVCRPPGSDRYVQVGIIAVGLECGLDIPALYTNVSHLMPWIEQQFNNWNMKNIQ